MKNSHGIPEALILALVILGLALFMAAQANSQTRVFTRTLTLETLDKHQKVTGKIVRRSDITFEGNRIKEKVLGQTGKLGKDIHPDYWNAVCLVPGFRPSIKGLRWSCSVVEYRGREPIIIEIDLEK